LKFDLVIKNVSEYTPWHSGMNGHQSNDGQFAELNLRANTKTKFEFMFVNPEATPQTSYPFNFTDNDKIEVGFGAHARTLTQGRIASPRPYPRCLLVQASTFASLTSTRVL